MSGFPVVVPAAGVGKRMQSDIPKQYLSLAGKTILEHTLMALHAHPRIGQVYVVLDAEDSWFGQTAISQSEWIVTVEGGKERADSVLAGLRAIDSASWVLVHDAARPCLQQKDIDALLTLTDGELGGILATPVRDTMKRSSTQNTVLKTVPREQLWHAQTPQLFPYQQLKEALQNALQNNMAITDEASAMESAGYPVKLIEGSHNNIKVTHPEDLKLAEFFLNNQ